MVSSVQTVNYAPSHSVANSNRPAPAETQARNSGPVDRVDVGASDIAASRAILAEAAGSLDLALASGREAAGVVAQMRDLARAAAGGDDAAGIADQSFKALLQRYSQIINGAIEGGSDILAGQAMTLDVDPDAPPVTVQGYDMRLKANPGAEDVLRLSSSSTLSDSSSAIAAARDADASLARIDTALSRLSGASQKLAAHDGFLATLDATLAKNVDIDLDADGARLTALQVRQTLAGSNASIANSAPGALLSLFLD